jgi:hypothetical protein
MAKPALPGSLKLLGAGTLALLVAIACGGESSNDGDPAAGSGGSAGTSAGTGGSSAGSSAGGKSSSGGTGNSGRGGSAGTNAAGSDSSGTGGTSDGAGGADGGTSGTGGSSGGSAGTGGEPPDVPLNQMCEDFEPCGGDPEGSWTVIDTCLETVGDLGLTDTPGCEDAVEGVGAVVEGTRTYENGEVTYEQTVTGRMQILVTDACAQGLLGTEDVDASMLCPLLPSLAGMGMTSMLSDIECAVGSDDECHCDGYYDGGTTTTTTTYTVDGSTITQGNGEVYDFCQQGDSLILHDVGDTGEMQVVDQLTVEFERS